MYKCIYVYMYIPSPTIHAKKARCDLKHRVCTTKPGFVKTTMYPVLDDLRPKSFWSPRMQRTLSEVAWR